ncbi:uncharacterized protein LOC116777504 isoform X1 [Danaus plexippus]|uniref:uncharacterized protein LOC116777504 isoform X1 n=1 Tax=Danaus plexippus TaxID=13037 RepID=UPI002AB01798|nr:uncharacterized protein LOC116777504 isoform X1 [Danaus plexippus]
MDKKRSTYTSSKGKVMDDIKKTEHSKKAKGDCDDSKSSSHTKYFQRLKYTTEYKRITRDEYLGFSESISGSSDSFGCLHGPEGKLYSTEAKLKRNFLKELDPVPVARAWTDRCPPALGWEIVETLEFLVSDPVGCDYVDRLEIHLRDFARTARSGYKIDILNSFCVIMDFLVENLNQKPCLREGTILLMKNMDKPILLRVASDVINQFEKLRHYIGFLGYLMVRVEDEDMFELVSRGLLYQLSARDRQTRGAHGESVVSLRHALLAAASPALYRVIVSMLAVASPRRFPAFLQAALILASASSQNCIEMIKENIIENIFYRFNPFYPERLPDHESNPVDPQDRNIKLGDSTIHMSSTLSLLLILLKNLKSFLDENENERRKLPCPDFYSQRCFIWAFRYECRAREHGHERLTLTAIAYALLHCYLGRLDAFSTLLMSDIMTLSVLTEIPAKANWTRTVNFNTAQLDVQFKKILISLSVALLKVFPYNRFMVESQHWLLGLMFLLDPGLCHLRAHWSPSLFAELRKVALQALVCTLPLMRDNLIIEYGLVRRLMWYVEWYSENPYELPVLYWCIRLLHVSARKDSIQELFDTHGLIILIHLCSTLLEQQCPPVVRSQVVLGLAVRLLSSAASSRLQVRCCVYPLIKWPESVLPLATQMLDVALYALNKQHIVSDRWLISLLNFIWEAIIWKNEYRQKFISSNGIYNLLDLITMCSPSVQSVSLSVIVDAVRGGRAAGYLVTWRAPLAAANANPVVVKRGSTIASLIASVFKDSCLRRGISLDNKGVIQNLNNPLMGSEVFTETDGRCSEIEVAGSRMSKAFALLQLLSEDLQHKVSIADESFNLYKNIKLSPEEETILILCSHYLTLKLNETWLETKRVTVTLLQQDEDTLDEFVEINVGWAKEIKRQQEYVLERHEKEEECEEDSLYWLLGRGRLTAALDALQLVRCSARSARTARTASAPRRGPAGLPANTILTYKPPLDDQNVTGQYVHVVSISQKRPESRTPQLSPPPHIHQ